MRARREIVSPFERASTGPARTLRASTSNQRQSRPICRRASKP